MHRLTVIVAIDAISQIGKINIITQDRLDVLVLSLCMTSEVDTLLSSFAHILSWLPEKLETDGRKAERNRDGVLEPLLRC